MPYKDPEVRKAFLSRYYQANKHKWPEYLKKRKSSLSDEEWAAIRQKWQQKYYLSRGQQLYRESRIKTPWRDALRGSKVRAKKRNIPFDLTVNWARARWTGKCEITGIDFVMSPGRNPYLFSPSLDRVVPSKGYTQDNCRFVLHAVNALKGAGTDEQMLAIARAIVECADRKNINST